MDSAKNIGTDVHRETISIAMINSTLKIVRECVVETKAGIVLQLVSGLRGDLYIILEAGT